MFDCVVLELLFIGLFLVALDFASMIYSSSSSPDLQAKLIFYLISFSIQSVR